MSQKDHSNVKALSAVVNCLSKTHKKNHLNILNAIHSVDSWTSYKLLVDPAIIKCNAKVYRYDGQVPGDDKSVEVLDPRPRIMRYWNKCSPSDLIVPEFIVDENYVLPVRPKEVSFSNINNNVNQSFLSNMCSRYGKVQQISVFYHPSTRKHLGLAQVIFTTSRAASMCVDKLNKTSCMGNIINVFLDDQGREREKLYNQIINTATNAIVQMPPENKNFKSTDVVNNQNLPALINKTNQINIPILENNTLLPEVPDYTNSLKDINFSKSFSNLVDNNIVQPYSELNINNQYCNYAIKRDRELNNDPDYQYNSETRHLPYYHHHKFNDNHTKWNIACKIATSDKMDYRNHHNSYQKDERHLWRGNSDRHRKKHNESVSSFTKYSSKNFDVNNEEERYDKTNIECDLYNSEDTEINPIGNFQRNAKINCSKWENLGTINYAHLTKSEKFLSEKCKPEAYKNRRGSKSSSRETHKSFWNPNKYMGQWNDYENGRSDKQCNWNNYEKSEQLSTHNNSDIDKIIENKMPTEIEINNIRPSLSDIQTLQTKYLINGSDALIQPVITPITPHMDKFGINGIEQEIKYPAIVELNEKVDEDDTYESLESRIQALLGSHPTLVAEEELLPLGKLEAIESVSSVLNVQPSVNSLTSKNKELHPITNTYSQLNHVCDSEPIYKTFNKNIPYNNEEGIKEQYTKYNEIPTYEPMSYSELNNFWLGKLNLVIKEMIRQLKYVLSKDMHKRAVENTAFKTYENWWNDNAKDLMKTEFDNILKPIDNTLPSDCVTPKITHIDNSMDVISRLFAGSEQGGLLGIRNIRFTSKMPSFRKVAPTTKIDNINEKKSLLSESSDNESDNSSISEHSLIKSSKNIESLPLKKRSSHKIYSSSSSLDSSHVSSSSLSENESDIDENELLDLENDKDFDINEYTNQQKFRNDCIFNKYETSQYNDRYKQDLDDDHELKMPNINSSPINAGYCEIVDAASVYTIKNDVTQKKNNLSKLKNISPTQNSKSLNSTNLNSLESEIDVIVTSPQKSNKIINRNRNSSESSLSSHCTNLSSSEIDMIKSCSKTLLENSTKNESLQKLKNNNAIDKGLSSNLITDNKPTSIIVNDIENEKIPISKKAIKKSLQTKKVARKTPKNGKNENVDDDIISSSESDLENAELDLQRVAKSRVLKKELLYSSSDNEEYKDTIKNDEIESTIMPLEFLPAPKQKSQYNNTVNDFMKLTGESIKAFDSIEKPIQSNQTNKEITEVINVSSNEHLPENNLKKEIQVTKSNIKNKRKSYKFKRKKINILGNLGSKSKEDIEDVKEICNDIALENMDSNLCNSKWKVDQELSFVNEMSSWEKEIKEDTVSKKIRKEIERDNVIPVKSHHSDNEWAMFNLDHTLLKKKIEPNKNKEILIKYDWINGVEIMDHNYFLQPSQKSKQRHRKLKHLEKYKDNINSSSDNTLSLDENDLDLELATFSQDHNYCLPYKIDLHHFHCDDDDPNYQIESNCVGNLVDGDEEIVANICETVEIEIEQEIDVISNWNGVYEIVRDGSGDCKSTKRVRDDEEEITKCKKRKYADDDKLPRELMNLLIPATVNLQKPSYKTYVDHFERRDFKEETLITYEIILQGIDAEDILFLRTQYDSLIQQHRIFSETKWIDHPITYLPNNDYTFKKHKRSHERKANNTGSARSEPFMGRGTKKRKLYETSFNDSSDRSPIKAMLGSGSNLGLGPPIIQGGYTDGEEMGLKGKKGQMQRDARTESRRWQNLLSVNLGEDIADVLKVNQLKFRKKNLRFSHSSIHSWGLFANEPIEEGEMIIEYVGEIVRQVVADIREKRYEERGIGCSYMFRIDADMIVDATKVGNLSRFINHSCNPNCIARIVILDGQKRICIYSRRQIDTNEEITYDYKFPREVVKIPCFCRSSSCRRTLN